ncbi:MAG: hypothetical protein ABR577_11715 [Pyrinomonadaceae bacterium]
MNPTLENNANTATPSQAYWNQRHALAEFRPRAEQLQEAVGKLTDLMPFQWAQLFTMALEFKPDVILELGRLAGNSTVIFTEAANQLGDCRVVSLCLTDVWQKATVPSLSEMVPEKWFDPLDALQADILTFDYEATFMDAKRVMIFWDAHGFDVAECVLGKILPLVQDRPHLVIMHDLSDARYTGDEYTTNYGEHGLWKGEAAGDPSIRLGHISSKVAQSVSIFDFTSRNKLSLHSADHNLHTELGMDASKVAELKKLVGDKLFSLTGHWFWFSLNENAGPRTFPNFQHRKLPQGEALSPAPMSLKMRLKAAASILLRGHRV